MSAPILLFDGVCNLCNSAVQRVIQNDKRARFRFSSLQSDFSTKLLADQGHDPNSLKSMILYHNGKLFQKSGAALRMFKMMDGLWPLLYIFIIVPYPIRDFVYDIVAKNRYKWFGKKDQCMVPSPELKNRFL